MRSEEERRAYLQEKVQPCIAPLLKQASAVQPEHVGQWLSLQIRGLPAEDLEREPKMDPQQFLDDRVTPVLRPVLLEALQEWPRNFGAWLAQRLDTATKRTPIQKQATMLSYDGGRAQDTNNIEEDKTRAERKTLALQ